MIKHDLYESICKIADQVTTLEKLKEFYASIEHLLKTENDIFYYNVYLALQKLNEAFMPHYDKTKEEIDALIEREGFVECKDPLVRFISDVSKDNHVFYDYYSKKLCNICGLEKEKVNNDISDFFMLFELYAVNAEGVVE